MAALGLCCCAWAFSSCGERGLSSLQCVGFSLWWLLIAEHGLQECGLQQLWHLGSVAVAHRLQSVGSVVVAHGLSCSAACFWIYTQQWNCWIIWQFCFQFFEKLLYCFTQWLHQFTFPPTVHKGFLFSTSSPTFVICGLFNDNLFDRCEVISHCAFNLHFSDD